MNPGLLCFLCCFLLGLHFLQVGLDEVVQPEAFSVLQVLHHEVGELVDVPRCLQHILRGQHCAVNLQHLKMRVEISTIGIEVSTNTK